MIFLLNLFFDTVKIKLFHDLLFIFFKTIFQIFLFLLKLFIFLTFNNITQIAFNPFDNFKKFSLMIFCHFI